jgi:transcriptional regulator with XRE-family HTH domain
MVSYIGKYLQDKRLKANLTQYEVAKKLGYLTAQYISNIERGIALPPTKSLKKFISLYSIPEEEFFELMLKAQTILMEDAVFKKKVRRG